MIRLLKFLWSGDWHLHNWEIHSQNTMILTYFNGAKLEHEQYVLKCSTCGEMKSFSTKA